ncbi:hypothetical protein MUP35_00745 [Patescibacteria group bacterium]|nr:hypothetical protein [Patescibacteria group bacterium]
MGSFKFKQRTAKLVFEDEEYAGAEVRVQLDFPIGEFMTIQRLQTDPDSVEELCRFIAGVLIDWNLEDEQGAIPATYEGVLKVPPLFIRRLCEELVKALTGPSAPLVQPSPAGRSSEGQ